MELLTDLQNTVVVLTHKHNDGSEVKYKTTLNQSILTSAGVKNPQEDTLYDLDTKKKIPLTVLENVEHYQLGMEIKYDNVLDTYFERGAKITW